jgi:hypothetical protein
MDSTPFRKLGDQNSLTGAQVYNRTVAELNRLPDNWQLTQDLCDSSRFCGIVIIDGKYVAVKGFERKIPCIWALDYLSHDPVHGDLFLVEDEMAFSQFFQKLYDLGYGLQIVVADDRDGLKQALLKVFPYAKLQLCHNHYQENIRRQLNLRSNDKYEHFFNSLKLHVFTQGTDDQAINAGWKHVWKERTHGKRFLQNILKEIDRRRIDLFNYLTVKDCPNTTNLIESYNSHLQGRLETIKGFQSFNSARRWLNGYFIRRRTKQFTDCKGKFKHLNKHCSLEFTIKKQAAWPENLKKLGIKPVKFFQKTDLKALEI